MKYLKYIIIIITILLILNNLYKPSINTLPLKTNNITKQDINTLKEKHHNPNIIGRLEIPNLFNILITQTNNNEYYLNHNINNKKDIKGNEFLDYRNNILDKQLNIYGHNSNTYNLPFHKLENFLNKDFFNNNNYIIFETEILKRTYQIVSINKVSSNYIHMNINQQNKKEHIKKLLSNSINLKEIEYTNDTNIIILQTCVTNEKNTYYLLIGFEI